MVSTARRAVSACSLMCHLAAANTDLRVAGDDSNSAAWMNRLLLAGEMQASQSNFSADDGQAFAEVYQGTRMRSQNVAKKSLKTEGPWSP